MSNIDLAARVGSNIRAARKAAGLTQGQLAAKVGASSLMAVSRWENGAHKPGDEFLLKLSTVLDHEPAWFFVDHDALPAKAAA